MSELSALPATFMSELYAMQATFMSEITQTLINPESVSAEPGELGRRTC